MYLTHKQKAIITYLAQGLKPSQAASLVNVTPAYISQLSKDPDFTKALEAQRAASQVAPAEIEERINNKYIALEDKLLDKIHEAADYAEARDLTKMLDSVTARHDKRRAQAVPAGPVLNVAVISLPAHAAPAPLTYNINEQSQITAIGQRLMAPLSTEGVRNLFSQMRTGGSPEASPQEPKNQKQRLEQIHELKAYSSPGYSVPFPLAEVPEDF